MVPLNHLAGSLINSYLALAVERSNVLVNEIPADITVEYNQHSVSSILNSLMKAVLLNTRGTRIRVSARRFGYVLVVELHKSGAVNGYAMACSLQDVNSEAEKIGGYLNISIQDKLTTVSFSFPNLPVAA